MGTSPAVEATSSKATSTTSCMGSPARSEAARALCPQSTPNIQPKEAKSPQTTMKLGAAKLEAAKSPQTAMKLEATKLEAAEKREGPTQEALAQPSTQTESKATSHSKSTSAELAHDSIFERCTPYDPYLKSTSKKDATTIPSFFYLHPKCIVAENLPETGGGRGVVVDKKKNQKSQSSQTDSKTDSKSKSASPDSEEENLKEIPTGTLLLAEAPLVTAEDYEGLIRQILLEQKPKEENFLYRKMHPEMRGPGLGSRRQRAGQVIAHNWHCVDPPLLAGQFRGKASWGRESRDQEKGDRQNKQSSQNGNGMNNNGRNKNPVAQVGLWPRASLINHNFLKPNVARTFSLIPRNIVEERIAVEEENETNRNINDNSYTNRNSNANSNTIADSTTQSLQSTESWLQEYDCSNLCSSKVYNNVNGDDHSDSSTSPDLIPIICYRAIRPLSPGNEIFDNYLDLCTTFEKRKTIEEAQHGIRRSPKDEFDLVGGAEDEFGEDRFGAGTPNDSSNSPVTSNTSNSNTSNSNTSNSNTPSNADGNTPSRALSHANSRSTEATNNPNFNPISADMLLDSAEQGFDQVRMAISEMRKEQVTREEARRRQIEIREKTMLLNAKLNANQSSSSKLNDQSSSSKLNEQSRSSSTKESSSLKGPGSSGTNAHLDSLVESARSSTIAASSTPASESDDYHSKSCLGLSFLENNNMIDDDDISDIPLPDDNSASQFYFSRGFEMLSGVAEESMRYDDPALARILEKFAECCTEVGLKEEGLNA
jgi:hypothetical protein